VDCKADTDAHAEDDLYRSNGAQSEAPEVHHTHHAFEQHSIMHEYIYRATLEVYIGYR